MAKRLFHITLLLLISHTLAKGQNMPGDSIEFEKVIKVKYDYAFNHPDSGLIIAHQLMEAAKAINYAYGQGHTMVFMADCYISKGDYARGIQSLLEARTFCVEKDITTLYQRINRPFGRLYIELGKPELAIYHQKLALKQATEKAETVIVTHSLAEAYYEAGYLDSALSLILPLYERVGTLWAAPSITLGHVYTAMGQYENALSAFNTEADLTFVIDRVGILSGKAIVFQQTGRIDSCRFYAMQALSLAEEKHFFKFINQSAEILANSYQTEDREQYLKFMLLSHTAKDSLYARDRLNEVNNFILADETHSRDVAASETKLVNQKRTFGLLALSLLLLSGGLFLWRNNRLKTKSNSLLRQEKMKVESTLEQLQSTQSQLIQAEKTARKLEMLEADRLRELNNLKTRLYTNITHEFRTPLTVIMGMNDNIEGHAQEKKLIKRNAENLMRLINQLLDLAKLDSGSLKVDVVQGDIIAYLQYLTESFYSMASDKKVSLGFKPNVKSLIMDFDEAKIQHIIYNLLSNAVKFTRPGGKVALETNEFRQNGQLFLQIKVKDTGIGIPQKYLPHIFDRFYQVEEEETSVDGNAYKAMASTGTGIGLALTKELIELMGGSITVQSETNWGTEFSLLLPVIRNAQTQKTDSLFEANFSENTLITDFESLPTKPDQILGEKPLVLVVEDNEGVVSYIQTVLEKDYFVQIAINGQEGIDMAKEHIPDLIITDVMMPEKNGYEVCSSLKQDERTSHIPIVMLTAKADISSKIEGLERGADAYLSKPFAKEELLVRLRKLLELREILQARYGNFPSTDSQPLLSSHEKAEETSGVEAQFLKKLYIAIETHIDDAGFSIPQLSREVHMSHTQLYRKLKALTGKTPSQFIRSIRLKKAMELLQHSSLNISEVAYQLGFNDPNYFSRMFKKEFEMTPGEVKRG